MAGIAAKDRSPNSHPVSPLAEMTLRLLWQEREISRAEIARRTDLARSTVSEIIASLLRTGLVAEVGPGPSSGGRRPVVLRFLDEARAILGVEIGATHVAVAFTDLRGNVLSWQQRSHAVRDDPEGTRRLVAELCEACLEAGRKRGARRLIGIGVALPCPVDPRDPERLSEIVLPAWKGRSQLSEALARFGVPVLADNDANMGALAEHSWGAARGVDDFTYIKVGTGIGSGHVIRGDIYRGATGVAGEIGHMAIEPHGERCICGLRGCLVTLIGTPALEARARALLPEYPESRLAGSSPTISSIEDAALAGDSLALRVAIEAAEHLGVALAGLLNLMNPGMVVLGGGLARLGELLLAPMRETVQQRTLVTSFAASEIRTSELGPRAVAIGAATLVLRAALADTRILTSRKRRRVHAS